MNYEEEKIANLILSLKKLKGVGNKTILKLLVDKKKNLESTTNYSENFLSSLGINAITKGIENTLTSWGNIQKESVSILELAFKQDIKVLHPYMKEYPKRLLVNTNFPSLLFCKGNIEILNASKIVAIIGTRKPTEYGSKLGLQLSSLLVKDDYVIVSGLAVGSDTIGHLGAIQNNGSTIAVLPTPIDAPVYPRENQKLADEILEKKGLLISEYAPGTQLKGRELINNLVARDEWQVGLSDGVIVIETSLSGGSNHAINHAIRTNTPLGIFDYSSRLKEDFFNEKMYEGNVKYIKELKAAPIFHKDTVKEFKQSMSIYKEKLIFKDWSFKKKNDIDSKNEQTRLF